MRMSLDTSEERAAVEEKAYIVYVRTWRSDVEKGKDPREQGRRVAGGGGRT